MNVRLVLWRKNFCRLLCRQIAEMRPPFDGNFLFRRELTAKAVLLEDHNLRFKARKTLRSTLTQDGQKFAPEMSKKAFNGILRNKRSV